MPTQPASVRPKPGTELELVIDSLAFGGAGVARLDGYVVFVSGGMPGDRLRARVEKSKRAYAQARVSELLEPSPDRVAPRAEHPGAPWQVLPYERQLEIKHSQLEEALRRIGRLEGFELEPIVPALELWRYRNKLEYSFGSGAAGGLICGFHAAGRWQEIVEVDDCVLASERSNLVRGRLVEHLRAAGLAAYDRRSGHGFLRNLVVREGRHTGQLQLRLITSPGSVDRDALVHSIGHEEPGVSLLWTQLEGVAEVSHGGRTELLSGTEWLEERIGEITLQISTKAFLQTNTEMAERLYELALDYASPTGTERAYDLYCGIGTIALQLAPRVAEVWGLELVPEAIADAIENARANEIGNVRFYAGDVRLALRELVAQSGRPDLAIVDPPRAGLSQKVVRRLIEAGPRRIVYISCNPTTLAPNAAQLVGAGYVLRRVRGVDMFPQTPHIECVALLEQGP